MSFLKRLFSSDGNHDILSAEARVLSAEARVKWQKCLNLMPLGTQTASKSFKFSSLPPVFIEKARGNYLYTTDGRLILDYCCALGPNILGYDNKKVATAIKKQLKKGILFSFPTELELQLTEKIIKIIPNAEMVRFAKNGSDAVVCAVRIARAFTGRQHIVSFGYHGFSSDFAITMMPNGIPDFNKELIHEFEFNNIIQLENILSTKECACVIMEPSALFEPTNYNVFKDNFLTEVRKLCDKYGALLIFDEIVTGFRYALGGCQERYGINADLICLGKAISNGMPLSAVAGKKKYMEMLEKDVFFSMTFGGETLSLAAAIATLEQLEKKDYDHIWELGNYLHARLIGVAEQEGFLLDFKGIAPRHYFGFNSHYKDADGMKHLFNQEMFRRGINFANVIYINFAHSYKDIDFTVEIARECFQVVRKNMSDIDKALEFPRPQTIFKTRKEQ